MSFDDLVFLFYVSFVFFFTIGFVFCVPLNCATWSYWCGSVVGGEEVVVHTNACFCRSVYCFSSGFDENDSFSSGDLGYPKIYFPPDPEDI